MIHYQLYLNNDVCTKIMFNYLDKSDNEKNLINKNSIKISFLNSFNWK